MKLKIIFILSLALLLSSSCKENKTDTSTDHELQIEQEVEPNQEIREIFYNMYRPDEMTRLFERVGANYDPDIINSADNFSRYTEKNRIAIAIGIYGVDLGYSRIFEQNMATAKYLSSIKILTEKIGIPESMFSDVYVRLEQNISNQDSVASITTELYKRTDTFLKNEGDDAYAALVVMGGWIEALYIASKILEYNSNNIEIMDRIAEQKYSLNSLLSLLSNYQDDISITENVLLLKRLKKAFDKFDIYYKKDDFVLDTITKTISTSKYESGLSAEMASEINHIVSEIRTLLVL